ncbi:hypothetical protein C9413_02420 [Rhizobium sp. SEMIA 4085]|uniref:Uncharacterized protein n=1 Tax=Rhizobium gallicum bv. gallicum R602sp TaxID=1041138 RepID=A0A0B4XFB8_9HYPH|nr:MULTISPECIES: hypothetical protein [Rhizobium]AJD45177.1 hypothetical protein RGR602_PC01147 [Rhizobium gallicum bv. gallicum R602sp]NNH28398.1 hypothetical protein [Rhizobium sp. SEMIA 4085]
MPIRKVISRGILALTITVAPLTGATLGISNVALAKDGNGNGNSGGGGNGNGNGGGNGGNHGSAGSNHGKSGNAHSKTNSKSGASTPTLESLFFHEKKTGKATKAEKPVKSGNAAKKSLKNTKSDAVGLSSLNRNYHAYMHSNDPRLAPVAAYVMAYAEFEKVSGPDVVPIDPALSDEALREALTGFTKGGVVSDDALAEAKEILGVGPAVGKIDEIRETLPDPEPVDTLEEPTTTETTTTVTIVTETPTEPAN